jgi:hypothetical protein
MKNVEFTSSIDKVLGEKFFDGDSNNLPVVDDFMDEIFQSFKSVSTFYPIYSSQKYLGAFCFTKFISSR